MNSFTRFKNWIRTVGTIIATPPAPRTTPHCNNINMLLMHLCDFDANKYSYVLQWLAYPLRNPGARMCYGLIINGDQGTGTNLFFQHVAALLHDGRARVIHVDALSDRFTNWVGAPLVVIDGTVTQRAVARIKGLMTSGTVNLPGKNEPRTIPNRMNFVFLSGDANCLRSDVEDRRFLVVDAPPAREKVFYQAVRHEIEGGGIDAFREYLLHGIDMEGFNESTLPPGLNRSGTNGRSRVRRLEQEAA